MGTVAKAKQLDRVQNMKMFTKNRERPPKKFGVSFIFRCMFPHERRKFVPKIAAVFICYT